MRRQALTQREAPACFCAPVARPSGVSACPRVVTLSRVKLWPARNTPPNAGLRFAYRRVGRVLHVEVRTSYNGPGPKNSNTVPR
jgi:hypothetical protein